MSFWLRSNSILLWVFDNKLKLEDQSENDNDHNSRRQSILCIQTIEFLYELNWIGLVFFVLKSLVRSLKEAKEYWKNCNWNQKALSMMSDLKLAWRSIRRERNDDLNNTRSVQQNSNMYDPEASFVNFNVWLGFFLYLRLLWTNFQVQRALKFCMMSELTLEDQSARNGWSLMNSTRSMTYLNSYMTPKLSI